MKRVLVAAVIVLATIFLFVQSGPPLIVDHPEKSDAILVLGGDHNDVRYWRGLELLRAGYGGQMILDESAETMFGRTYPDLAADFVARTAGEQAPNIHVCAIQQDSTLAETADAAMCLAQLQPPPHAVLLVTSDLSHATRLFYLPQTTTSVSLVSDCSV